MPLDPDYPKQRLAFMLEDRPSAVDSGKQGNAAYHQAKVICPDADWAAIARAG